MFDSVTNNSYTNVLVNGQRKKVTKMRKGNKLFYAKILEIIRSHAAFAGHVA